jgi:hypothetical protein
MIQFLHFLTFLSLHNRYTIIISTSIIILSSIIHQFNTFFHLLSFFIIIEIPFHNILDLIRFKTNHFLDCFNSLFGLHILSDFNTINSFADLYFYYE